ncbi:hypothetical protein IQ06DRAFT_308868 [Phaeosphaeriaceae sp. SRC1lsM3a]|nr:hypothetical protein IQ06DRAFT_308868 [Stagonospora sp. SRC1lsM3a]
MYVVIILILYTPLLKILPVGSAFRAFLVEVTSHGALAIATGPIFVDSESYVAKPFDPANLGEDPAALTAAIDWIHANAGKGEWQHIDSSRIVVAGNLKKSIFYLLGGPTDVTYPNGERNFAYLPQGTPAWKGNHALGHIDAFELLNAGIPGIVGSHILQWMLRGKEGAKDWFTGVGPRSIVIQNVEYKSLDKVHIAPI